MPKQSCANCRFMRGPYVDGAASQNNSGWCHRTVPAISPDLQTASHRPIRLGGWCGEWRWKVPPFLDWLVWAVGAIGVGLVIGALQRML